MIEAMASCYLNSYAPLVTTAAGRSASERLGIAPFVDGSIRREPDLEHAYPAISCLCRADKFAPRLREHDVVAYMLRKGRYGSKEPQRRLTAILRVVTVLPTHTAGAAWYRDRGLALPNNCMVAGNAANPLERSHRLSPKTSCGRATHREWDTAYRARAMKYGAFVVCDPLFVDLSWNAPTVTEDVLVDVFGRVQPTLNPERLPMELGRQLAAQLGIEVDL